MSIFATSSNVINFKIRQCISNHYHMEKLGITTAKDYDDYHRSVEAIYFANETHLLFRELPERYYPVHESILFSNVQCTIEVCLEKAENTSIELIRARFLLAACRLAYAACQDGHQDYLAEVCNRIHPRLEAYLEKYDPFSEDTDPEIESVMMNIMSEYFHMLRHDILPAEAPRIRKELMMKAYTCGILWLEEFESNKWENHSIQVQLRRLRDLINYGACRGLLKKHEIARHIFPVIEERMEHSEEFNPETATLYANILLRLNDTK